MAWSATFGAATYGVGQTWDFDATGGDAVNGLRGVTVEQFDFTRAHGAGAVKGPTFKRPRVVMISLLTKGTPAAVMDAVDALVTAWQPLPGATTTTLVIVGEGNTYTMTGAPTDIEVDLTHARFGKAIALCQFTDYSGAPVVT